jgi:hypothetical protein
LSWLLLAASDDAIEDFALSPLHFHDQVAEIAKNGRAIPLYRRLPLRRGDAAG